MLPASGRDQKPKPRPISFGGVFSRTPKLVPRISSPARSMSIRISNTSNLHEGSEQPSHAVSVSPHAGRKPDPDPISKGSEPCPSPSPACLNPDLPSQTQTQHSDKDQDINNRFRKFSFVPSYATSSPGDTSDGGEGLNGESDTEDGRKISRFGSVSTSSEYPPAFSKKVKSTPSGNKHHARDAEKGSSGPSKATKKQRNFSPDQQHVSSFFDPASSDGEEDHNDGVIFLGNAQQASFRKPVMVNHHSNTQLGLVEVLNRGPTVRSQNVSPFSSGPRRALSPGNVDSNKEKKEARCSDIIGWPTDEPEYKPRLQDIGDGQQRDECVSGFWKGARDPFAAAARQAADGLRSHPVSVKNAPRRQVTFPQPSNLDIRPEQRFAREDVVSTPYPRGPDKDGRMDDGVPHDDGGKKANLTLVVYGHRSHVPKIKKLSIPTAVHEISSSDDSHEGHPPIKAIMRKDFDDTSLFNLIRSSYSHLRGSFFVNFGARTVCGIRLLSYQNICQLTTQRAKHACFESRDEEDGFAEARMLELYRNPKIGQGKWEWFAWIKGLPENDTVPEEPGASAREKVALELIEGFSARRILVALMIVTTCSVVASLLWIFVGADQVTLGAGSDNPATSLAAGVPSPTKGTTPVSASSGVAATTGTPTMSLPSPISPTEDTVATFASFSSVIFAPSPLLPAAVGENTLPAIIPTMKARDQSSTSSSSYLSSSSAAADASNTNTASELNPSGQTGRRYALAGTEWRVGAGVALGVLVMLFGWMGVVGWIFLSWMAG